MKGKILWLVGALVAVSMILTSCAQPTPETVEVEIEVPVEVEVTRVVEVEGETVVETVIETQTETVIVTATPEPVDTGLAERMKTVIFDIDGGRVNDPELFHPYVRPQETGNRTEARWVAFRDGSGTGLLAVGIPTLDWSALPYLAEDLDEGPDKRGRHDFDLPDRDLVAVHLDHRQLGVGGDNSWGAQPLEPYRIPVATASWAFRLAPLAPDSEDPMILSRTVFPAPSPGPRPRENP